MTGKPKTPSKLNDYLKKFDTNLEDLYMPDPEIVEVERPYNYDAKGFVRRVISRIIDLTTTKYPKSGLRKFLKYDTNRLSIVFQYSRKGSPNILMTGDADLTVFNRLMKRNEHRLKNKVLKVPHHGSKTGINRNILRYINPEIAIISNGYRNRYRHPSTSVVNTLRSLNIHDYYTNSFSKLNGPSAIAFIGRIQRFPVEMK